MEGALIPFNKFSMFRITKHGMLFLPNKHKYRRYLRTLLEDNKQNRATVSTESPRLTEANSF